jgi:hypothetical protein
MAATRKVSLFEREVTVRLSSAAVDLLAQSSSVITEGSFHGDRYQGSTMVTVDLRRAASQVSDPIDATTSRRLAELLPGDPRAQKHVRRLALHEARRNAGSDLHGHSVDVRAKAMGDQLHLDLDLEASRRIP